MHTGSLIAAPVNLNGPGRYLHWSIFTVSEANLVLIAVMALRWTDADRFDMAALATSHA